MRDRTKARAVAARPVNGVKLRDGVQAVVRGPQNDGEVSEDAWEQWIHANRATDRMVQLGAPAAGPDRTALAAFQNHVKNLGNLTTMQYGKSLAAIKSMGPWLTAIPQGFSSAGFAKASDLTLLRDLLLVDSGWSSFASLSESVFAACPNYDIRPDPSTPSTANFSTFGDLHASGRKGWDDESYIVAEGTTPTNVMVGTFSATVEVPEGTYVFRATSTPVLSGGYLLWSESVDEGSFAVQTRLDVTGDAVDPSGGGTHASQECLHHTFGDDHPPPYGFFSSPGYVVNPLTVECTVVGPGTIIVKEIVNYYLELDDYETGAEAVVSGISGSFEPLYWELIRPFNISAVV